MEEFKKLSEMLEKIHGYFIKANHYFVIWQSLEKLINQDNIWMKKAKQNLDVMNRFKTFFKPVIDSCKDSYILELAKCLDTDKDALSIHKVLAFSKENITKLTYENYKIYNQKIDINDSYEYKPITIDLLDWFRIKLKWKSKIIQRLLNFRNQFLGHNQLNPNKDSSITIQETEELMKLLMEIWNTLSQHLFRATWWHNFSDKNTYEEIERLLDFLHRFEIYRIQELKDESQKLIEEYNKKQK